MSTAIEAIRHGKENVNNKLDKTEINLGTYAIF